MLQQLLIPFLLLLPTLQARPEFRLRIPNGMNTNNSGITCEHLGHIDCIPGAPRNPFGLDFARLILGEQQVWRDSLCQLDSDGDGLTNGEELGDPCCVWTMGEEPARVDMLSHPGVAEEFGAEGAEGCVDGMQSPEVMPTEGASDRSSEDAVCFPAHATVRLEMGGVRRMDELQVGDRVWVSERETSDVFLFTHRIVGREYEFVTLRVGDGEGNVVAGVTLTKGHYLYVNGGLSRAGEVMVGDEVEVRGVRRPVVAVECAVFKGLYNPQTVHGDLLVDGVRVSTYTEAVEVGLAHSMLAPVRLLYKMLGWSLSVLEQGADRMVKLLP